MTTFWTYIVVIITAALSGLLRFKKRDKASKLLVMLLLLTLISEMTAYVCAIVYHNNMFVYHIFAPIQLLLLGLYFDNTIDLFKKKRIGIKVGILGVITATINTILFQPLNTLNSNFLLFEGLIIMAMVLYAFQRILNNDNIDIFRYHHFWFNIILVFFWSLTYTIWALYNALYTQQFAFTAYLSTIIKTINIITYAGFGVVFLYFSNKGVKA